MIGNTLRLEQVVHGPNRGTLVLFLFLLFSHQIVDRAEHSVYKTTEESQLGPLTPGTISMLQFDFDASANAIT
ncbi:hypothetical protein OAF37_00800 [Rubripirellula sp.]|nr:hypothetical protein [Rubripirellula sp.]